MKLFNRYADLKLKVACHALSHKGSQVILISLTLGVARGIGTREAHGF